MVSLKTQLAGAAGFGGGDVSREEFLALASDLAQAQAEIANLQLVTPTILGLIQANSDAIAAIEIPAGDPGISLQVLSHAEDINFDVGSGQTSDAFDIHSPFILTIPDNATVNHIWGTLVSNTQLVGNSTYVPDDLRAVYHGPGTGLLGSITTYSDKTIENEPPDQHIAEWIWPVGTVHHEVKLTNKWRLRYDGSYYSPYPSPGTIGVTVIISALVTMPAEG